MNRRVFIMAGAAVLLLAPLVQAEDIVKDAPLEYKDYGSYNKNTGICCYAYNDKGLSIHFKSGIKKYWYSREVFGEHHMGELIARADAGKGLNSYVNFLKRWTRPKDKQIKE